MKKYFPLKLGLSLGGAIILALSLNACSSKEAKTDTTIQGAEASGPAATDTAPARNVASETPSDLKTVYFAFDSYSLTGDTRSALKTTAQWLKGHPSDAIQIEGHCDERGSTEYNLALGERRANAVKNYLGKLGVDGSKLSVISYGSERPADPGHDEAAWAKNRRAVPTLTTNQNVSQTR
jgi:peptidoglycan-associated lipoprotein